VLGLAAAAAVVACSLTPLDDLTRGSHVADDGGGAAPPVGAAGAAASAPGTPVVDAGAKGPAGGDLDSGVPSSSTPPVSDASTVVVDAAGATPLGGLLAFGAPTSSSPLIGGDSGAPFADSCPAGAALVGLNLVVDVNSPFALLQIQAVCAAITVSASGVIAAGAPAPLADEGSGGGARGTLVCPAGTVVAGVTANAEKYVHALVLDCAALVATRTDTGFTIGLGQGVLVGPFGGSGGNPVPAFQCPPPTVANALSGSAGGSGNLDSIVIGCATPLAP
jgi:hypothetical protein